ncbi:MAG TPA: sigma-70 domain-containing protein [Steroidobacteraceae bacterium]|nr:sigma-70 domain-containing protein [Steroidobacteraceae bacterium]
MPNPEPQGEFRPQFGFDSEKNRGTAGQQSTLETAYEAWRSNQRPEQMTQLLDAARPVIDRALSAYAGGNKALTGRAKRLAIDAFKTFDPTRGAKLRTHLYIRLQPLQRAYTKRTSPLAVPERVQLDLLRLQQTERAMRDELNREPADMELAERLNMSPRRIAHVRAFSKGLVSEGQLRSPEGEPLQLGLQQVSPDDLWVEYVHHDLSPIDKKIFEWKTGIYGKKMLSTNEIARRLNISPSAVSQRALKIAMLLERLQNG